MPKASPAASSSNPATAKARIVSGIRTSGDLHLGNYLGALKRFVAQQDENDCYFFLADLHGLTTLQDPAKLRGSIRAAANVYLACGLDPAKVTFFRQSGVSAHTELGWLLTSITSMGELSRMTQFKDKTGGQQAGAVAAGLFVYPPLMAADILLYRPDYVPVGDDQKQHVELTRDLAIRFNHRFGETFVVPEVKISQHAARIKGLDDPSVKMSKSAASAANYIAFADSPEVIRKKIAKAVTDSGDEIRTAEAKPALTNLLNIYSLLCGRSIAALEKDYAGKPYSAFKSDLADVVVESLGPIQKRLAELAKDPAYTDKALADGAAKARPVAEKTLTDAKKAIGL